MIKWIAIGVTALGMLVGAVFFLEDRYFHTDEAEAMNATITEKIIKVKEDVSKDTLNTFKDVQQSFQSMQKDNDMSRLEALRDRKYLLERQLSSDPNNEMLKERIEMLQRQIEKLENKLYK
jgi:allophanate hydrolase subunit 1